MDTSVFDAQHYEPAKIIMITSAKGGVGKSTVCANLSLTLAQSGKRVLAIDLDMDNRCLDLLLHMEDSVMYHMGDVLSGQITLSEASQEHPRVPGLTFVAAPPFPIALPAPEVFAQTLTQAAAVGTYDFILLDTPGSVSDILPLAAPITDTALIVSSPQATAVRGAQRAGDVLAQMGVEDLALIVNQYDFSAKKADPVSDRLTLIEMIDRISIRLLGVIPFCSRVWKDQNDGVLITDASYRKNDFAQSFSNIAKRLEHKQIPLLSGFRRNK